MDKLYAKYGELMIQREVITNQIEQVRREIAEQLAKKKKEGEKVDDPKQD